MKNFTILSGKFTGKQNFSGYSSLGQRVHIFGLQMLAIGVTTDADVKFPFYCVADNKTINEVDTLMKPTGITHERLTALSVFKTKAELINAHVEAGLMEAEIASAIGVGATTLGLTKESIDKLVTASL
jgi:hypothetical protein